MRLIDTKTLEFVEVWGEKDKEYVILSHRWEDGELTFQDMKDFKKAKNKDKKKTKTKKGFTKIEGLCRQARRNKFSYAWIDTCCINKDSSAELAEAINSMYQYYKSSAVCYTYLSDVSAGVFGEQFKQSGWFTRGWTLQELIAPHNVVFFDRNWHQIGTKLTLLSEISKLTGIDKSILDGSSQLYSWSIAQRMSWASQRVTTRIEDTAYCLLGIFDINMPLLYGEGKMAFIRLQEEIIKRSDDHTIFAWPMQSCSPSGLLAESPSVFANCQRLIPNKHEKDHFSYTLTYRGLSLKLLATPHKADTYLVRLNCSNRPNRPTSFDWNMIAFSNMGIFVRRLDAFDQFARVECEEISVAEYNRHRWTDDEHGSRPNQFIDICVRQDVTGLRDRENAQASREKIMGYRIQRPDWVESLAPSETISLLIRAKNIDLEEGIMFLRPGQWGMVGVLDFSHLQCDVRYIMLGFDFDFNPICFVARRDCALGHSSIVALLDENLAHHHSARPRALGGSSCIHWVVDDVVIDDELISAEWPPSQPIAELVSTPGMLAFKGSSQGGLCVGNSLKITESTVKGRRVWDVDFVGFLDS